MKLKLAIVPGNYAVCRMEPASPVPQWFVPGPLASITYTGDETSLIVPQELVPEGIKAEKNWKVIKVLGPLEFWLTGILASVIRPLAEEGISIFAVSTYDTDFILVQADNLERSVEILSASFTFVD